MNKEVLRGKPDAGYLCVRSDEREAMSAKSRLESILHMTMLTSLTVAFAVSGVVSAQAETLTVAQGATQSLTTQQTYDAEEIHGTLNL